jgi:hypothetical protein
VGSVCLDRLPSLPENSPDAPSWRASPCAPIRTCMRVTGRALERLSRAEDGRIAYRMKRPLPDGTTHLLFTGLEFLRRVASLVPPPRALLARLLYGERAGLQLSCRFVRRDHHPVRRHALVHGPERAGRRAIAEQALAGAEHEGAVIRSSRGRRRRSAGGEEAHPPAPSRKGEGSGNAMRRPFRRRAPLRLRRCRSSSSSSSPRTRAWRRLCQGWTWPGSGCAE